MIILFPHKLWIQFYLIQHLVFITLYDYFIIVITLMYYNKKLFYFYNNLFKLKKKKKIITIRHLIYYL